MNKVRIIALVERDRLLQRMQKWSRTEGETRSNVDTSIDEDFQDSVQLIILDRKIEDSPG